MFNFGNKLPDSRRDHSSHERQELCSLLTYLLRLLVPPTMVGISLDSIIRSGDVDRGDSKVSGPSLEETRLGEWSTSRTELWCFYLYYVVRILFFCIHYPWSNIVQRAIMDSPLSILARLNCKIFSILQAMTRASRRSLSHAEVGPIACSPTWGTSATVGLAHCSFVIGCARVAHESIASFSVFFLLHAVNSIILLTNGISFAIQAILLLMIGAWADYGTWRCV
jgi:Vacuole effluxer Atg22 like